MKPAGGNRFGFILSRIIHQLRHVSGNEVPGLKAGVLNQQEKRQAEMARLLLNCNIQDEHR